MTRLSTAGTLIALLVLTASLPALEPEPTPQDQPSTSVPGEPVSESAGQEESSSWDVALVATVAGDPIYATDVLRLAATEASMLNQLGTPEGKRNALMKVITARLLKHVLIAQGRVKENAMTAELKMAASRFIKEQGWAPEAVTDQELLEFFVANRSRYDIPATAHVKEIRIDLAADATPEGVAEKKKLADNIRGMLDEGAEFEALAEQYSDNPATKGKGGDLGYQPIPEGGSWMQSEFSAVEKGKTTKVLSFPSGFFIYKVVDYRPRRAAEFGNLRHLVKREYIQQAYDRASRAFFVDYGKKVGVTIEAEDFAGAWPPEAEEKLAREEQQ